MRKTLGQHAIAVIAPGGKHESKSIIAMIVADLDQIRLAAIEFAELVALSFERDRHRVPADLDAVSIRA